LQGQGKADITKSNNRYFGKLPTHEWVAA